MPHPHNWALWVTSMLCIHGERTWYFKFPSLPVGGCCTPNTNPYFLCLQSWKSPCETRGWETKGTLVHSSSELLLPGLPVTGMREGLEVETPQTGNHLLPPAEALFNLLSILKSPWQFIGHLLCAKSTVWWLGVGYWAKESTRAKRDSVCLEEWTPAHRGRQDSLEYHFSRWHLEFSFRLWRAQLRLHE